MLGFAPLGTIPLAAALASFVISTPTTMAATGGFVFSGTGDITVGESLQLEATGGIIFGGSTTPLIDTHMSTTGTSILFNGSPLLRLAGKPIIITALPDSFDIRAEKQSFDIDALPDSFTLRWHR